MGVASLFSYVFRREKRNAISLTLEASRQQLENLSGVTVIIATFTNWALTINIEHLLKVEPLTVAEIQQVSFEFI